MPEAREAGQEGVGVGEYCKGDCGDEQALLQAVEALVGLETPWIIEVFDRGGRRSSLCWQSSGADDDVDV